MADSPGLLTLAAQSSSVLQYFRQETA